MRPRFSRVVRSMATLGLVLWALGTSAGTGFSVGSLLEPVDGLYRTAVRADVFDMSPASIESLTGEVRIVRDTRGVPHIFAQSDRDALIALGWVTAQDRLFQLDFMARTSRGRLAEVLGPDAIDTDRFFRSIGMKWAVDRNAAWIRETDQPMGDLVAWYQDGVNAWIDRLDERDDPFEFRLLGYRPHRFELEDALSVLTYMTYDLSYTDRDFAYSRLKTLLPPEDYDMLFPAFSDFGVPIVSGFEGELASAALSKRAGNADNVSFAAPIEMSMASRREPLSDLAEGLLPGKGSNNWAVAGSRSSTGFPILAGDMHLNLSLPSIWYEAHLVTPDMNVYGVTIPGAPAIVEGITPTTAWAFTNTGSDQLDYYALSVSPDGDGYIVDGERVPFEIQLDTIRASDGSLHPDTLRLSRFGPVVRRDSLTAAIRWVAHDTSRTIQAIWEMGHARDYASFEAATRKWDAPMQNILFAGRDGTIAIRSTGYLPVRGGRDGSTVLDGSTAQNDWTGRVPFEELPHSIRPERGALTSTNQQPAGPRYPYYLGHDWGDAYRSIRIDSLLRSRDRHSVRDIASYQADVHAVQADLFLPLISTLDGLDGPAEELRERLLAWDGNADLDATAPPLFDRFLSRLETLAWDEVAFQSTRIPAQARLLELLETQPDSKWLDRPDTPEVESGPDLLRAALEEAAADVAYRLERDPSKSPKWGEMHHVLFRHLTRSEALHPLWRGPYPYPGYRKTLSPAASPNTTHSASWRVVVDLSTEPPTAQGVYPGGESGNPFSTRYDAQIPTYLAFERDPLLMPAAPDDVPAGEKISDQWLLPSSADRRPR